MYSSEDMAMGQKYQIPKKNLVVKGKMKKSSALQWFSLLPTWICFKKLRSLEIKQGLLVRLKITRKPEVRQTRPTSSEPRPFTKRRPTWPQKRRSLEATAEQMPGGYGGHQKRGFVCLLIW